jgi:hypothetical protein
VHARRRSCGVSLCPHSRNRPTISFTRPATTPLCGE